MYLVYTCCVLSRVWLFVTPWTVARQAPLLEISQARILEWVAVSSSQGSSWPGIEPMFPALAGRFFTTEPPGKPLKHGNVHLSFSSVQLLSRVRLFATPWIAAQQASLSITNSRSSLRLMSIESVMPSSHLFLCHPLLLLPPMPPSISLFQWVSCSHEVAKVLEFQLQHHSLQRNRRAGLLQNGLVGSPCSPWDSQESSSTPQLKSINSSALSLLHSPTLTSMHDYRKNHSLD